MPDKLTAAQLQAINTEKTNIEHARHAKMAAEHAAVWLEFLEDKLQEAAKSFRPVSRVSIEVGFTKVPHADTRAVMGLAQQMLLKEFEPRGFTVSASHDFSARTGSIALAW